jgi:hypothetical protein
MASHLQRRRMPLHALSALDTAGLTRPQRVGVYLLIRGPRLERPSVISLSAELRQVFAASAVVPPTAVICQHHQRAERWLPVATNGANRNKRPSRLVRIE